MLVVVPGPCLWTGYDVLRGLVHRLQLEIAEGILAFGLYDTLLLGWLGLVSTQLLSLQLKRAEADQMIALQQQIDAGRIDLLKLSRQSE